MVSVKAASNENGQERMLFNHITESKRRKDMRGKSLVLGLVFITAVTLLFCNTHALAQYPTKPIQFLAGFSPGGSVDLNARMIGSWAHEPLGQPFVIINRPGATGTVAAAQLAMAKPDGYTILFSPTSTINLVPHFLKVAFELEDFEPIVATHAAQMGFCVRAEAPYDTFREFIDYAREHPGLTYAHTGRGGNTHLTIAYLAKKEGIEMKDIPYRGGVLAASALLGGHVDTLSGTGSHIPYCKSGKFKLLLVYTSKRMKEFPDVPTLYDLGYTQLPEGPVGHVILAPRGIPEDRKETLEKVFTDIIKSRPYARLLGRIDAIPDYKNSSETKKSLAEEHRKWGEIIKELGIKLGK